MGEEETMTTISPEYRAAFEAFLENERIERGYINYVYIEQAFQAGLKHARAESEARVKEWQPIETAPRDQGVLLGHDGAGAGHRYQFIYSAPVPDGYSKWAPGAGWQAVGRDWPAYPKYWMHLPQEPKP